jgi:16S rRNA (guanine(966)-N(2))-methyltransferase RsmD
MRVSGGLAKGHQLMVPSQVTDLRPSQDQVREAIFNILGDWVVNKDVLDIYAGTGSLGIEALSRGARTADFIDRNRDATEIIKRNLNHTHLQGKSDIFTDEAEKVLSSPYHQEYDLIFLDPPYVERPRNIIMKIPNFLKPNGVLVYLHGNRIVLEDPKDREWIGTQLVVFDNRKYGKTYVSYMRKNTQQLAEVA